MTTAPFEPSLAANVVIGRQRRQTPAKKKAASAVRIRMTEIFKPHLMNCSFCPISTIPLSLG
jgi:hypothetical protein